MNTSFSLNRRDFTKTTLLAGAALASGAVMSAMHAFVFDIVEESSLRFGPFPMLMVQKYSGTSVGTVDRIHEVARRCIATQKTGHDVVVI